MANTFKAFEVFLFLTLQTSCIMALNLSAYYDQFAHPLGLQLPLPNISSVDAKVSKECWDAVLKLDASTIAHYLDALGKPGSGMLIGNFAMLGSYSECTKTIADAHYCTAFLSISSLPKDLPIPVPWGLCTPKQCSEHDITRALRFIFKFIPQVSLKPIQIGSKEISVVCDKKSEYTTGVIITLALCGYILSLCLLGTIVDCTLSFLESRPSNINENNEISLVESGHIITDKGEIPNGQEGNHVTEDTYLLGHSPKANSSPSETLSSSQLQMIRQHWMTRFFMCFSLVKNTSFITDTSNSPGNFTSLHGMRVLSMWWVILGHCYFMLQFSPVTNLLSLKELFQRFTFQAVQNSSFSVDTFFVLSGLLATYLSLRRMDKNNGKLSLFHHYFHRFWRLTPPYMFLVLFYDKLNGFLGKGPLWFYAQNNPQCEKYWWTNLLYINNFYPKKTNGGHGLCMGWTWYLADDMQFYIIAPVILFIAYRFRLRGLLAIVSVLLAASFVTTATIYYSYDLTGDDYDLVYTKPYCRIPSYLVGMVLGYLLHKAKDWRLPTKVFNVTGWCLAIILAVSTLYGKYQTERQDDPQPFSRIQSISYGTFARFAWSLAIAWVIFACQRGLGGLVNRILSARFWILLSRLNYCAYLVHFVVLLNLLASNEFVWTYSDVHMAYRFVGVMSISYGVAFILSVCVEVPARQLEKLILKRNS
ncbi:nose resistant to fluoxetine protein 6-like [Stylophora pistillata]|uniref:nose resistant to fluoxetine protein 6-like n=1 Tax=Stylophora pistillata TaxID=50429 RepID=UPI000C046DC3|nr:nose resistant to fluoxetine protein 6-like [Stylophora pistillata]